MYPVAVVLQYSIQYYTMHYTKKHNTYTLKTIHNTKITNTVTKLKTQCTQNYKQSFTLTSRIISITTPYYRKHETYKR
jgi:hypothetical protein